MAHVVLLGDSIFDNLRYVPGGPAVIDQLRSSLPRGWSATLLAVDGSVTTDVGPRLRRLPAEATHLVVSVGGNDALGSSSLVGARDLSAAEGFVELGKVWEEFRQDYRAMLTALLSLGKPTAVCTIYDAIPGLTREQTAALSVFNDVIIREASGPGIPVIDLRAICDQKADYSDLSPIEPSRVGGAKIADVIAKVCTEHDFTKNRTVVYGRG